MNNPVVHWEIASRAAAKSQEFYRSLFGWKVDTNTPGDMEYAMVESGREVGASTGEGINGGIFDATAMETPPYLTFYVQVDDIKACVEKVESLGGKTVMPPAAMPGVGMVAQFTDPDGNMIGLIQPEAA